MRKKVTLANIGLVVVLFAVFVIVLSLNLSLIRSRPKTVSTPFITGPLYSKKPSVGSKGVPSDNRKTESSYHEITVNEFLAFSEDYLHKNIMVKGEFARQLSSELGSNFLECHIYGKEGGALVSIFINKKTHRELVKLSTTLKCYDRITVYGKGGFSGSGIYPAIYVDNIKRGW